MKTSSSRQKLSQMHAALDRELEDIDLPRKPYRSRQDLRFIPQKVDKGRQTKEQKRQYLQEVEVNRNLGNSKRSEMNQLQKKLMDLEKKMDNLSVSSGDSIQMKIKRSLNKQKSTKIQFREEPKIQKQNEDTARFLMDEEDRKEKIRTHKYRDSESEDSEQYEIIQKQIEKNKAVGKSKLAFKSEEDQPIKPENTDRRNNFEADIEEIIRPKSVHKRNSSVKVNKILKQSFESKKSVQSKRSNKRVESQKGLTRQDSKRSLKSNKSARNSHKNRNNSLSKNDRSYQKRSQCKDDSLYNEQVEVSKDHKKIKNLQKQVLHYKRLSKRLHQSIEQYKIMQIQFRNLKTNFSKSQQIRNQQKRIIQVLKSKLRC